MSLHSATSMSRRHIFSHFFCAANLMFYWHNFRATINYVCHSSAPARSQYCPAIAPFWLYTMSLFSHTPSQRISQPSLQRFGLCWCSTIRLRRSCVELSSPRYPLLIYKTIHYLIFRRVFSVRRSFARSTLQIRLRQPGILFVPFSERSSMIKNLYRNLNRAN